MRRLTIYFRCAVALAGACAIGGCAPRPDAPNAEAPIPAAGQLGNIFAPVRVRIHPLTHFVRPVVPGAAPHVEAHVELLDRWGLPVRALGELRFVARFSPLATRLIATSNTGFTGVIAWSVDLSDPDRNASDVYDRITHTYRIRLSDPALGLIGEDPFTLEALFITPGAMVVPASTQVDPGRGQN